MSTDFFYEHLLTIAADYANLMIKNLATEEEEE